MAAKKIPLAYYLVLDGPKIKSNVLKEKLIVEGLLEYKCAACGNSVIQNPFNGNQIEPLPLHLDHINGNKLDNRIENLRLLDPTCHSLTPTYTGRNKKLIKLGITDSKEQMTFYRQQEELASLTLVCKCGNSKTKRSKKCTNCSLITRYKIEWPEIPVLLKMLETEPCTTVARRLKVSDNAVRKHIQASQK